MNTQINTQWYLNKVFVSFILGCWLCVPTGLKSAEDNVIVLKASKASQDWALQCRGCHGARGEIGRVGLPVLQGHVGIFLNIPEGREYLVQVPGVTTAQLTDERLADLLNWMLNEFHPSGLPDEFVPYMPAEVNFLRKQQLSEEPSVIRGRLLNVGD